MVKNSKLFNNNQKIKEICKKYGYSSLIEAYECMPRDLDEIDDLISNNFCQYAFFNESFVKDFIKNLKNFKKQFNNDWKIVFKEYDSVAVVEEQKAIEEIEKEQYLKLKKKYEKSI